MKIIIEIIVQLVKQIITKVILVTPVRLLGYILLIPISVYMAHKFHTILTPNSTYEDSIIRLPKWCRWYDNLENYQPVGISGRDWTNDDGILGDHDYRILRGTEYPLNCSLLKLSYEIYVWLAIRNKTEYLNGVVLGYKLPVLSPEMGGTYDSIHTYFIGDFYVENNGDNEQSHDGLLVDVIYANGPYYEIYYVKRYGNTNRCFRMRLGYKNKEVGIYYLKNYYVLSVMDINPFARW